MPQTHTDRRTEAAVPKTIEPVQKASAKKELAGQDFAAQEAALVPDGAVQLRASGQTQMQGAGIQAAAAEGVRGGGGAMPYLDQIQASFGRHDVSHVQAHVGGAAKDASEQIGAEAYATGDSVAFRQQPDVFTAAHEAAHIVQQQAGVNLPGGVGQAGDAYEKQADAVAAKVVAGESAESLLGAPDAAAAKSADQGVQQRAASGAGAAVQKDEAPGELPPAKVASAIAFNNNKNFKPAVIAQIAAIVGSSSTAIDATFVKAVAAWQAEQGCAADGKIGDITMAWLAQEPGGVGLENLVKSDNVLYVGLNPASRDLEHKQLANAGHNVTAVKGEKKQDTAKVNGQTIDLSTQEGRMSYLGSLVGMTPERAAKCESFMGRVGRYSKDETAQIMKALNDAECGRTLFTRAVLSGHSGGWSFWGDDNGEFTFREMAELPTIFPKALGCVQDLCLSACNTGQSSKLDQYKAIFPNVKSIWAYVGYSPSAATGALRHIGNWAEATKGALNEDKIDAARDKTARGSGSKDKNVATLVAKDDGTESYKTSSPEAMQSFDTLKALVDSGRPLYDKAMSQGIIDKQGLSTFYTNLQNLLGMYAHRLPNAAELNKVLKQTLFLRYWENVTKKFMEAHGTKVKESYGTSAPPAYSGASRDKVLGFFSSHPDPSHEGGKLIKSYLIDLDPDVLPATWA